MSIRLKLTLFISFLFITVIANSILTFQLEFYGEEKLKWVIHTHEVINDTENLLSGLKDAETGQRGYLLTKNPVYLEPYYTGIHTAKKYLKLLKNATSDNQIQQERLVLIKESMKLKLDELKHTIQLGQNNNDSEALAIIKENKGKKYMDDIRDVITNFINTENLLLEKRKGDFRVHKARIATLISIELILFVILAFFTSAFLKRTLFAPLELLISSTHRMEKGEKIEAADVLSKDEIGTLFSRFIKMSQKVHDRTEKLDYEAHHDELTGLINRTKIFDGLQNSINISKESDSKSAVLFLDLNKFKQLNDTFGHDVGDLVLKETATRLQDSVRSGDTVFRIG